MVRHCCSVPASVLAVAVVSTSFSRPAWACLARFRSHLAFFSQSTDPLGGGSVCSVWRDAHNLFIQNEFPVRAAYPFSRLSSLVPGVSTRCVASLGVSSRGDTRVPVEAECSPVPVLLPGVGVPKLQRGLALVVKVSGHRTCAHSLPVLLFPQSIQACVLSSLEAHPTPPQPVVVFRKPWWCGHDTLTFHDLLSGDAAERRAEKVLAQRLWQAASAHKSAMVPVGSCRRAAPPLTQLHEASSQLSTRPFQFPLLSFLHFD